jgi:hypothetical protein
VSITPSARIDSDDMRRSEVVKREKLAKLGIEPRTPALSGYGALTTELPSLSYRLVPSSMVKLLSPAIDGVQIQILTEVTVPKVQSRSMRWEPAERNTCVHGCFSAELWVT